MKLESKKYLHFQHTAYEMKKDILYLCHECGSQKAHLGGCLSCVDILNVLYTDVMNLKDLLKSCNWECRDKFVMSKGHAGIAMYAALKQAGVINDDILHAGIRGDQNILYRHPKYNPNYGIECSVGSLGMGIGYAVGLAEVARKRKYQSKIYVLLGDGECNEGSVWESLAYATHRKLTNMVVIIDKNGLQLDGETIDVLNMNSIAKKLSSFGYQTIEIDGHDYEELYQAFHVEPQQKPLAIVAKTIKGKGISFAENKVEWHDNFVSDALYQAALDEIERAYSDEEKSYKSSEILYKPEVIVKEKVHTQTENILDYTDYEIEKLNGYGCKDVIGYVSNKIADRNSDFILTFSDCANRIGIEDFKANHPYQCFEMGIAEQNQVAVSSAMALNGYNVYSIAYAPFITARVLDQIRSLLGYMKSPVKLIGLTAGYAASDLGATHTALEDIANMRAIPNMIVICPSDCTEIAKTMIAVQNITTPVYIRITAAIEKTLGIYKTDYNFEIGKAITLKEGNDIAIIGCGSILGSALESAEELEHIGLSCKVINMHTIKPLDTDMLDKIINYNLIVTIEEHNLIGGLGSAVAEYISKYPKHGPLLKIGVPDTYYVADLPLNEYNRAGLTKEKIKLKILKQYRNA